MAEAAEENAAPPAQGGETPAQEAGAGTRGQSRIGWKHALALAGIVALAALVVAYIQEGQGAKEVSLAQFKAEVNESSKAAVFQDLREVPAGDARQKIQDCGVQLSYVLSLSGKNVTNYALDGESCYGGLSNSSRTPEDCFQEAAHDGRLAFVISFNATQNKTRLTQSGAYYYGDSAFLSDCAITGLVR
jgi:hypothetical protein